MALIRVEDAKLSFGVRVLFENVSFSINEGDRIGLVGNNGCGKSSLMKALVDDLELDKGLITRKRGLSVGYVPQEIPTSIEDAICYDFLLGSLPAYAQDSDSWRVDVALGELGLQPELWHKPIKALSGGWRRLLLIAGATLKEPGLLILDEPTNHLDLGKVFHLEHWLKTSVSVPYMVISHDREFLDQCTTKTLFMRSDGVHDFSASFSTAREQLLQKDTFAENSKAKEEQEVKRLERAAQRLREWSVKKGVSVVLAQRAKAVSTRAEKIKSQITETYTEQRRDIRLHQEEVQSDNLIIIKDVHIAAPDGRPLFSIDRLVVKQGERIAVLGVNGTGKTMLLNRLLKEFKAYEPGPSHQKDFYFNPQVRIGYLDQHLESLPQNKNVHEYLSHAFDLNNTQTIRELANAGFPLDQQFKSIGSLSFGERARVALLALKLSKPNLYVLDEPSNHLDIQGQEALEEELDDKGHTCIFISHDRRLVRGASTRFLEIRNGRLVEVESVEPFYELLKTQAEDDNEAPVSTRRPNAPGAAKKSSKGRKPNP